MYILYYELYIYLQNKHNPIINLIKLWILLINQYMGPFFYFFIL
jgi:hypothetical protein